MTTVALFTFLFPQGSEIKDVKKNELPRGSKENKSIVSVNSNLLPILKLEMQTLAFFKIKNN
jgi:hypothetical protein